MKRFYFLVSLLIGLIITIIACGGQTEVIVVATPTPGPPPAPAEMADALVTALNAGDITALAALYTDDAVFSFGPMSPEGGFETLTGKAAVLADDLESIANNAQLSFSNVSVEGDMVKGEFSYADDELQGGGVDRLTGTFEIMVEGGKIASIKPAPDTETQQKLAAAFAPPAPRELTLLVGGGQDTLSIQRFSPSNTVVRAGDTVTWKLNQDDEPHTVSFLSGEERIPFAIPNPAGGPPEVIFNPVAVFPSRTPGGPVETYNGTGFAGSGIMMNDPPAPGVPPNNTFTLVMETPGTYDYVCLLHPPMQGTITVVESNAIDVLSQSEIDAQSEKELAEIIAETESLRAEDPVVRSEAGPNGTTIWHAQVGAMSFDQTGELFDFLPKNLTIQEGDTVIWSTVSPTIHTVTFHPGREQPTLEMVHPQEQGPPVIEVTPDALFPSRPAAEFDGTGYWNSGLMDTYTARPPGGSAFSMTFSKAGSYDYICVVHQILGMTGNVTVTERATAAPTAEARQVAPIPATARGPAIPQDKGYLVEEISDGLYWITQGVYQIMFLTTGEGVIVVDAPPSLGNSILLAIAEVTSEPITHVIYSHAHGDHIAAASIYPEDAVFIAHEETAVRLAGNGSADRAYPYGAFLGGSAVPEPTVTFQDSFTLTVGSQTLELQYPGPNHQPGNIFIYAPKQKVLMVVDVFFPGWSPFKDLAVSESVPGYLELHDTALEFDFNTLISGHLTRSGTREDVEIQREYVLDMQANAAQALQTVDFAAIAEQTGFENLWLLFDTYLTAVAQECADLTLEKWAGRLGAADVFTESHCFRLMESLRIN